MSQLLTQRATLQLTANKLERRQLDGREHVIVPATIIVAGVLNGELVPPEALADFAEGWNGRPVPIRHPQDEAGNYIIANDPGVIESQVVGQLFNMAFDTDRIKGEMWLDVVKAQRLGAEATTLLQRLEAGEVVELSTGYYAHVEPSAGTYKGQSYTGIQGDLVPDHVALLPDEVGACSVADGCGAGRWNALRQAQGAALRVNQAHSGVMLAFYLRPEDAQALALGDGPDGVEVVPAQELHVTLAYLGDIDELEIDEAWLLQIANDIAQNEVLVTADVCGHGRFVGSEEDGTEAVFAIVQSEQLYRFRRWMVGFLSDYDSAPDCHWGYLPHITLAYAPAGVKVPLAIERRALVFDQLAVSWGDRTILFPLQGQVREEMMMNKQEKEQAKVDVKKPVANEAAGGEAAAQEEATVTATVEATVAAGADNDIGALLAEFGGAQGLRDALAAITANAQGQRQAITARLTANRQCAFSAEDLGKMDLAQLIKLDRSLTPANYGGQAGVTFNSADDGEWAEYTAPTVK